MPRQEASNRIAKNTLILYARQLFILLINLYTVRAGLNILGVEDYGIYSVVAGIVSLFSFLSGTMASATQRYFSFVLGANDTKKLDTLFSVNIAIYFAIGAIAIIALETGGLWFVHTQLHVPDARAPAVYTLYQFTIIAFIISIISTLFVAMLIAHEDMKLYAYVSTIEATAKLGLILTLEYLVWDKLVLYGIAMLIVASISAILYIVICYKRYHECQLRKFHWDKSLFKEILDFTTWTMFGQITTVGRNQAVTILLNQTFNPIVVAARTIAVNVAAQINVFAINFNIGLYPSVIKSYAEKDLRRMHALIFAGSKATFILMWLPCLPLFLEMDQILKLWLKSPPVDAILFTRLALVESLVMSVSLPIATAARAPGKMKIYELSLGVIQIAIFLLSWLAIAAGGQAYSVFIVAIAANVLMLFTRLIIVKDLIALPVKRYIREVISPVTAVALISSTISFSAYYFMPIGTIYTLAFIIFSITTSATIMYFIGLNVEERHEIYIIIKKRLQRVLKKHT